MMTRGCCVIVQIVTLVALVALSYSSSGQEFLKLNFTVKDGLPSPTVFNIFEDSIGQLWFATPNGVCRYDSREFVRYSTEQGLNDPYILQVKGGPDGSVWALSKAGTMFYTTDGQQFHPHPMNKVFLKEWRAVTPRDMQIFHRDSIIIYTNSKHFIVKWDTMRVYSNFGDPLQSMSDPLARRNDPNLQGIFRTSGNLLSGNLYRRQHTEPKPFVIAHDDHSDTIACPLLRASNIQFNRIYHDTVIISYGNYIAAVVGDSVVFEFEAPSPITNSITLLKNHLYFGTFAHGLFEFPLPLNPKDYRIYLENTWVYFVQKDLEGGMWIATKEEGLYYAPGFEFSEALTDFRFNHLIVITGGDQEFAVGTESGTLLRMDKSLRILDTVASECLGIRKLNLPGYEWMVSVLAEVFNGYVVGRTEAGLLEKKNHPLNAGWYAQHSPTGMLFSATSTKVQTLKSLDTDEGKYEVVKNLSINTLYTLSDTSVLILTDNGMYMGSPTKAVQVEIPEEVSIPFRVNNALRLDSVLFVASHGNGIVLYRMVDEKPIFQSVLETSGSFIHFVREHQGQVWFGSERGLSKLIQTAHGLKEINVHEQLGLPVREVQDIHFQHDTIYLATSSGIEVLPGQSMNLGQRLPVPIRITDVTVNDQSLTGLSQQPQFDFFNGLLGFKISTISYRKRNNQEYQYRLLPGDSTWITTNKPSVQFSSLTPGEYVFEARTGVGQDGHQATYQFSIRAPFFLSTWFKALAIIALTALILGPVTWWVRESRIRTRHALDLTRLKLTSVSAQMNPHFIFNSLNSIHSFILKNDSMKSAQYLSRFSQLVRVILDSSLKELSPLSGTLEAIDMYVELEQLRFNNVFSFEKSLSPEAPISSVKVPPLLIQPFVENAILHGLVPKADEGLLQLKIYRDQNRLVIEIEDDGVGFNAAKRKAPSGLFHNGKGSRISYERIELYNRLFKTDIRLNYTHLKDKEGAPCGTRVHLDIPLEKPFLE